MATSIFSELPASQTNDGNIILSVNGSATTSTSALSEIIANAGGGGTELTAGTDLKIVDGVISVNTDGSAFESFAFVAGSATTASGIGCMAVGINTSAIAYCGAFACGEKTYADYDAHAEGYMSMAKGSNSHAEGNMTSAFGFNSHAEGASTYAEDSQSHAEGYGTSSLGYCSHAEGYNSITYDSQDHAEGNNSVASGGNNHAECDYTSAIGFACHTEGSHTLASGNNSHVEGYYNSAYGDANHAEGWETVASGQYTHTEGYRTKTLNTCTHAEGYETSAKGYCSHAEGFSNYAEGEASHAEGAYNQATGSYSHAEGYQTSAKGNGSHAEGLYTFAADIADHVEGIGSYVEQGGCNHVEGFQYHTYITNGPASNFYGTNKVKLNNAPSIATNGSEIDGSLYEFVKAFKDRFIVSCDCVSSTEYHYVNRSFFKPKLYKIIDVSLIEETNQLEITIDGIIDCQTGGAIYLWGPTSISIINSTGGMLNPGQVIDTFTINGLHFPGNSLENVRPDNCFLKISITYTPVGASEATSFHRIIKPTSITYNSTTNEYTFECDESIELPTDAQAGGYILSVCLLNSVYYGCNHIEGRDNVIKSSECSHIEGLGNYIQGSYAHAEGCSTSALREGSHAEGQQTKAAGSYSHAEGYNTSATGQVSHSEGYNTYANGDHSHAEGYGSSAYGKESHAEGYMTSAEGQASHTEGYSTYTKGGQAHAEGHMTSAIGGNSHSEGDATLANKGNTHSEGWHSSAMGNCSHVEGETCLALGSYSHAQNYRTSAIGDASMTIGSVTVAGSKSMFVMGNYNKTTADVAFVIGNGTTDSNRSDAFIVDWNGVASATNLQTSAGYVVTDVMLTSSHSLNESVDVEDDVHFVTNGVADLTPLYTYIKKLEDRIAALEAAQGGNGFTVNGVQPTVNGNTITVGE
jgi:hypothetical protein